MGGCPTDSQKRLDRAAIATAKAGIAGEAYRAGSALPDNPADCGRRERSGVVVGDRLDIALLKTDRALGRANARIVRCDAWFDELKRSREGKAE
ncbi:hypothetical protein [Afifella sp. IM 167]|uniref:hypothetical protein n=1 Tax=Afifella sp. IM 167 TaxID=2033586 RepID=UPI001CC9E778|nr:hypothetical protein [Afifella sp. IM 167]MBZ8133207.1 hypothetical protein [Afifella sp. IM 167]